MTVQVPDPFRDLLLDETRAFAYLATVMEDGSPQVTPVWFDVADGVIRVNTAVGRTKWRNMMHRPQVAILIARPDDPYRCVQIRGVVTGWTKGGASQHMDQLAKKYRGWETYPMPAGQQRVTFTIRPDSISVEE